jgi:hypothetical protein
MGNISGSLSADHGRADVLIVEGTCLTKDTTNINVFAEVRK